MAERLQKLERAAEVTALDKPQAVANKDHATAIATLVKALDKSNQACVQAGNLLLLKNGDDIIAKTLSPAELRAVEKNQALLKQPQHLLHKLQVICEDSGEAETSPDSRSRSRALLSKPKAKREKDGDT